MLGAMNARLVAVIIPLFAASAALAGADKACSARPNFVLLLHGGTLETRRDVTQRLEVIRTVLAQGRDQLRSGATALDVAEATVRMLEDSAAFNAGRGSNANRAGFIETDASIMDGRDLRAGSVASMRRVRNAV